MIICQRPGYRTFSDLAASQARLMASMARLERRFLLCSNESKQSAQLTLPGAHLLTDSGRTPLAVQSAVLTLSLTLVWGIGLFAALDLEVLGAKLLVIAAVTLASMGLDRLFSKQ